MANVYNMVGGGGGGGIKLQSISVITQPAKTTYRPGQTFDPAGMVVQATYSNGATATATGYTYTPSTPLTINDTTITILYTEQGKTATAQISITVQNEQIAIPVQSGTLIYNGQPQSPTWTGYDPSKMTISGTTQKTDSGSNFALFTLLDGYCWPGGTTEPESVIWTIDKAEGSITLDKTSVTLDIDNETAFVEITRLGDGGVFASSSDTSVATITVIGTTLMIFSVDDTSGTATITISVAESQNYTAASATVQVTADFAHIYGAQWDGSSTTKLTRTDGAALFTDPVPAVGTGSGSSPFDNLMPWSGMVRVTQNSNALVAIPKYWVKVSHNPFKVQISDSALPGYQVSPAHRDRGDGKGERDVVYIGRYECDGFYRSSSGQTPKVSTSLSAFRRGIHTVGDTYWQADYAIQLTWWFLYIVEYADWNGQTAIGQGNVRSSAAINTGATDSMTYHTGRAAGTDGQTAVQYRNIENPWGNVREWRDGIIFAHESISTYNNPVDFSDSYNGTGATVRSNSRSENSGWIKAWGHDTNDPSFIYPSEVGGSETMFVPDYCNYSTGVRALYVGGGYGYGADAGPFYLGGGNAPTSASAVLGSRLQKLP